MRMANLLRFKLALIGILAMPPAVAFSLTWQVPSQCPTIHAGLDSAAYGDTVLVAPGTYLRTDDPETWIHLSSGERLISEAGAAATTIEFCNMSTGIVINGCEDVVVSGFSVRFGTGPGCSYPPSITEGVSCWASTNVLVQDCIIEHVYAGISVSGQSTEWHKPMFKNNEIRKCGYGIYVRDVVDPGRPSFQGNVISECTDGAYVHDSMPVFDGNRITDCRDWGICYYGNCGGECLRNVITHNGGGVYINADPPYAAPSLNGGLSVPDGNDIFDNTGYDLSYECCRLGEDPWPVYARLNYWGSRCPDSATVFHGPVYYEPWVDSTHTEILNRSDCPDATEPTTWGSIKAMFK